jgi:outer membrane protein assembly factor BamB
MLRLISALVFALLLSGCGTFADPTEWFDEEEANAPTPLGEIVNTISVQRLWIRDTGAGTDERRLNLAPLVASGVVYVAAADGDVQALDAETGRTLWSVELDLPVSGGPGVGEGMVLLGTSDGELIALAQDDGELRWRAQLSSEVLSIPQAANGTVVVNTNDGKLFGLEATNGNERWRYEREVPVLTLRGTGSPVLSGGAAYIGMSGGKLVALRIDNGGLLWDASITVPSGRSELERLADIDGDPLVFGGGVFVATYQGEVAAVEQRSGRQAWRRNLSAYSGMAADGRRLFLSDEEGVVWALDVRSGSAEWSQDGLKFRRLSDAAVLGDYVVLGDFEGYVHWIDRNSGELLGRTRVGSAPITTGIQVNDDLLFVQGDDGDLAAYRLPR